MHISARSINGTSQTKFYTLKLTHLAEVLETCSPIANVTFHIVKDMISPEVLTYW